MITFQPSGSLYIWSLDGGEKLLRRDSVGGDADELVSTRQDEDLSDVICDVEDAEPAVRAARLVQRKQGAKTARVDESHAGEIEGQEGVVAVELRFEFVQKGVDVLELNGLGFDSHIGNGAFASDLDYHVICPTLHPYTFG